MRSCRPCSFSASQTAFSGSQPRQRSERNTQPTPLKPIQRDSKHASEQRMRSRERRSCSREGGNQMLRCRGVRPCWCWAWTGTAFRRRGCPHVALRSPSATHGMDSNQRQTQSNRKRSELSRRATRCADRSEQRPTRSLKRSQRVAGRILPRLRRNGVTNSSCPRRIAATQQGSPVGKEQAPNQCKRQHGRASTARRVGETINPRKQSLVVKQERTFGHVEAVDSPASGHVRRDGCLVQQHPAVRYQRRIHSSDGVRGAATPSSRLRTERGTISAKQITGFKPRQKSGNLPGDEE